MHEFTVLPSAQAVIHAALRERNASGAFARSSAIKRLLELPLLLIVQARIGSFQGERLQDVRQGGQIFEFIPRGCAVAMGQKPAGSWQSSGGQAPWPPLQVGYVDFVAGTMLSSMRIPWRQRMFRSYSYTKRA